MCYKNVIEDKGNGTYIVGASVRLQKLIKTKNIRICFVLILFVTEYRAKKCGTHIYAGKSRKIILKFQVWISVIKKILDGMTM